jgi:hypothetical protein
MTQPDWIDAYLVELKKYQMQLDHLHPEMRVQRIEILSKRLVLLGKLAAEFSEQYKRIYATRKRVYAEAKIAASKNKTEVAELAVADLREEEAQAYGNMIRFKNAFISTQEEANALKYKVRIDIEDGSSRRGM